MTGLDEVGVREQTVRRLLMDESPSIQYWALRDVLGKSGNDKEALEAQARISSWAPVRSILEEQHSEGYWGEPEDMYWPKWTATVWPLILLGEIGISKTNTWVKRGCEYFLKTMDSQDRSWPPNFAENDPARKWDGYRSVWEPCVTGNMARTLTFFGLEDDGLVREMFEWLVRTQLPDGGWNCEPGPWGKEVFHSSFMSSIEPLWAFSELPRQKWPKGGREAVERACEFMLIHRLYKSEKTGKIIDDAWTRLHFPLFYEYDILHGLRVLTKLGFGGDERTRDAFELLRSKRLPDGTWPMEDSYLTGLTKNLTKNHTTGEWVLERGEGLAKIPDYYAALGSIGHSNPWITLNALRVLESGRT